MARAEAGVAGTGIEQGIDRVLPCDFTKSALVLLPVGPFVPGSFLPFIPGLPPGWLILTSDGRTTLSAMPIYEYYCPDNNRIYQFFAKTLAQGDTVPNCPDDPAFRMVKMVSGFAIGGATKKSAGGEGGAAGDASGSDGEPGATPGGADVDDPRMEAAFSQLEREMESIDENDPRAMGRMMRRMSELTGEKLDGEMEEMVRKLEEGTDPEKLEEQFGDLGEGGAGDDDPMGGMGGFGGSRGAPSRDPHLYDY